jgi:hypothetical protein
MFYTSTNSTTQPFSDKALNKKITGASPVIRFNLASLPFIDPHLVSIAALASRLIDEMEDVFNQIANAASNGDKEFTVPRRLGGSYHNRHTWYKEVRLELDEAFDLLIRPAFMNLVRAVSSWYCKITHATSISSTFILESRFNVEPPIEIRAAVQALNLASVKRQALTDMVRTIH